MMNLITPFQFREMFAAARSFAIVGNAPTILDYQNGPKIDSADVVVRFNRATTAGKEDAIGSRTDILVVNANNSLEMAPSPNDTVKPRCLVCYVAPQGVPNATPEAFTEWVGDLPILLSFGPDLIDLPAAHHTRPMTSGTYFLLTLLRMFDAQKLFITGFTMFGVKGGSSAKYYRDDRGGVGTFHDLDVESQVFAKLLTESDLELEMTPEVQQLAYPTGKPAAQLRSKTESSLKKKFAAGISWRMQSVATRLRRYAEAR